MYTRKNKGPSTDPWGTPADIDAHCELLPFKEHAVFGLLRSFESRS